MVALRQAALTLLCVVSTYQSTFAETCPVWESPIPEPVTRVGFAYDTIRNVALAFGGDTLGFHSNQTWEWNSAGWILRSTTGPAARGRHAMVFDSARGVFVLFGGKQGGMPFGDTWEWDGLQWILRATTGPSARAEHAMAFDS